MSRPGLVSLCSILVAFSGCAADGGSRPPGSGVYRIACTATPDCAARGGFCMAGECHADNECAADADCAAGETCVPDPDFGGLCARPAGPVVPGPAWTCALGKDCPAGQGCGDDGLCHGDGECTAWSAGGAGPGAGCGPGQICYNAGNDDPAGFCGSERPARDPYCRSDGLGACRLRCYGDGTCSPGATCAGGFCHDDAECASTADCSPNHVCGPARDWEDYGYSICHPDDSPTCVDDGAGACRLPCATDADCLHGGGCAAADHLCHASNECAGDGDCDPGLLCYASPEFGGLCGPGRP